MKLVEELMVGRSNIKTDKMMKNRKMTRRSERNNKEMVGDDEMTNLPSSHNKKRKKREISSHHHLPSHMMVDKTISPSLLLPSHVTKSKSKMITRSKK